MLTGLITNSWLLLQLGPLWYTAVFFLDPTHPPGSCSKLSRSSLHSTPNSRPAHSARDLASFLAQKMADTHVNSCRSLSTYLSTARYHLFSWGQKTTSFSYLFLSLLRQYLLFFSILSSSLLLLPANKHLKCFPSLTILNPSMALPTLQLSSLPLERSFTLDILRT